MRYSAIIEKKKRNWVAAIVITVAAVCMSMMLFPTVCYAFTATTATVTADGNVRVRKEPVSGDTITTLTPGTVIRVVDETAASDGHNWYKIELVYAATTTTGYVRADLVTITAGDTAEGSTTTDTSVAGTTGVVANTELGVYVRSGPGTSYSYLAKVYKGQAVSILGQASGGGLNWYNVTLTVGANSYTGWICTDYVSVGSVDTSGGTDGAGGLGTDETYVASLKAAGFPDSYCSALAALHQKYPNWQFVPVMTGLDWGTVIANESTAGKNLVQTAVNDARKSTDTAAYNWATNQWYGFDGSGWVCASPEYIAYCMDPRNFLNETYIFQFETLEYASYQNTAGVSNILAGTFMAGNYSDTDGVTRNYAETFVNIGASLGVSPYHLASRCKQEQGTKGTSPLISGSYSGYEGYFNYYNIRAYTTALASATVNGLSYAKTQGWNTRYKSIAGGSSVVANKYVKKGQNTIYFEKFNVVYKDSLYSHQYMTNVMAAMSEGSSMAKAYSDKSQAFVFRIPVYNNMPETAVTFADKGNPNNWLSSISVNGYNLTPAFNSANTAYTLVVGENVSSIAVSAAPVASTSTVSGTGNYTLNYGNNTVSITCISQSGVARTYTITVARQQPSAAGGTIEVASGATVTIPYVVGTAITGIQPGSSASSVLANISAQNCSVKILKADGTENAGNVGTGNKITVYVNGAVVKQYEVVIYGDINGDGKISNTDLVLLQKHILGIQIQTGCYYQAADVGADGTVSNKDNVLLQKHILNISQISQ